MIDVPCTEGHLRVKAEQALDVVLSPLMSHPILSLFLQLTKLSKKIRNQLSAFNTDWILNK